MKVWKRIQACPAATTDDVEAINTQLISKHRDDIGREKDSLRDALRINKDTLADFASGRKRSTRNTKNIAIQKQYDADTAAYAKLSKQWDICSKGINYLTYKREYIEYFEKMSTLNTPADKAATEKTLARLDKLLLTIEAFMIENEAFGESDLSDAPNSDLEGVPDNKKRRWGGPPKSAHPKRVKAQGKNAMRRGETSSSAGDTSSSAMVTSDVAPAVPVKSATASEATSTSTASIQSASKNSEAAVSGDVTDSLASSNAPATSDMNTSDINGSSDHIGESTGKGIVDVVMGDEGTAKATSGDAPMQDTMSSDVVNSNPPPPTVDNGDHNPTSTHVSPTNSNPNNELQDAIDDNHVPANSDHSADNSPSSSAADVITDPNHSNQSNTISAATQVGGTGADPSAADDASGTDAPADIIVDPNHSSAVPASDTAEASSAASTTAQAVPTPSDNAVVGTTAPSTTDTPTVAATSAQAATSATAVMPNGPGNGPPPALTATNGPAPLPAAANGTAPTANGGGEQRRLVEDVEVVMFVRSPNAPSLELPTSIVGDKESRCNSILRRYTVTPTMQVLAELNSALTTYIRGHALRVPLSAAIDRKVVLWILTTSNGCGETHCIYHDYANKKQGSVYNDIAAERARRRVLRGQGDSEDRALSKNLVTGIPQPKSKSPLPGYCHCGCLIEDAIASFILWKRLRIHSVSTGNVDNWGGGGRQSPRDRAFLLQALKEEGVTKADHLFQYKLVTENNSTFYREMTVEEKYDAKIARLQAARDAFVAPAPVEVSLLSDDDE
ncbi:hypothetical protein VNI00_000467 [Paramarasmius palmivorus]|uniref:Uncharacterized protein n=1 Tax=Paramarasmius palmivorus TaxID=297713 RepID=A0AAW0E919_9AGAR